MVLSLTYTNVSNFRRRKLALLILILCLATMALHAQGDQFFESKIRCDKNFDHFPIHLFKKNFELVSKENLGLQINTQFEETKPILSADGRSLYFARKHHPENTGGTIDPQDIWMTNSPDGQSWKKSTNLGGPINTPEADNLCAVIHNNVYVFFLSTGKNKGSFGTRSYSSGSWSALENTGPDIWNESPYLESCFSSTGNVVLYTAKTRENILYRKDVDERDLYVSVRDDDGWSSPINLGKTINSGGDEFSPFLSSDGNTLYFGTNGRGGYGDVDIFMSRKTGKSWTSWTEPVNLGPEINTKHFDAYFTLAEQTDFAYMVSNSGTYGKGDIIRFKLPANMRPEKTRIVEGYTLDENTNRPVKAFIQVRNMSDRLIAETISDFENDGAFNINVPDSLEYTITATSSGHFPEWQKITPLKLSEKTSPLTILLEPFVKEESFPLRNVLFEKGSAIMKENSTSILDDLVLLMSENTRLQIHLKGHTDNIGSTLSLKKLSEERVSTIKNYLIKKGIEPSRISGKGYGGQRPIVQNTTEENRMTNRRVEFIITLL